MFLRMVVEDDAWVDDETAFCFPQCEYERDCRLETTHDALECGAAD